MFTKTFVSFASTWDLNIPRIEASMLKGMKPGKILRQEILLVRPDYKQPDWLMYLDGVIQDGLAALYAAEYVPEVKFAYSREKIEEIYADENCPSCMTGAWANEVAGEFYNANGFVVAYRHNGKNVTARCVTYGKTFSEAYGPESRKLIAGLEEMGYHNTCEESMFPTWTHYMVPYHNGNWYIPYLDNCGFGFIPLDQKKPMGTLWECLLVPMSVDDGIENWEDVPRFRELGEQIEAGLYLDVMIEKTTHGAPCKINGAMHHIEQVAVPEIQQYWNLEMFNGRLFWDCYTWNDSWNWKTQMFYMDDYGNAVEKPWPELRWGDLHMKIKLGELGQF